MNDFFNITCPVCVNSHRLYKRLHTGWRVECADCKRCLRDPKQANLSVARRPDPGGTDKKN